jgi:hypothetical protein
VFYLAEEPTTRHLCCACRGKGSQDFLAGEAPFDAGNKRYSPKRTPTATTHAQFAESGSSELNTHMQCRVKFEQANDVETIVCLLDPIHHSSAVAPPAKNCP